VVYRGHAEPAAGPVSPANRFWFNHSLKPHGFDPAGAAALLRQDGFRMANRTLRDRDGHAVEFSVITNAGNHARERMAAMMQQDLAAIGIRLNSVTLDFASLIERITRSYDYEACLLGFTNVDLDPSSQMSVWLSSSGNHPWHPNQKTPATLWEAEIDRLMRVQASAANREIRKAAFDRVQEIVSIEAPLLYLVNRNSLVAISPSLQHVTPSVLSPQIYWNIEHLAIAPQVAGRRP
jgi:peptide/nickel transport system substrate-binding protein